MSRTGPGVVRKPPDNRKTSAPTVIAVKGAGVITPFGVDGEEPRDASSPSCSVTQWLETHTRIHIYIYYTIHI